MRFATASTLVLLATTAIGFPSAATWLEHRSVEKAAGLKPRMFKLGEAEQSSKSALEPSSKTQPENSESAEETSFGESKKKRRGHRGAGSHLRREMRYREKRQQQRLQRLGQSWGGASSQGGPYHQPSPEALGLASLALMPGRPPYSPSPAPWLNSLAMLRPASSAGYRPGPTTTFAPRRAPAMAFASRPSTPPRAPSEVSKRPATTEPTPPTEENAWEAGWSEVPDKENMFSEYNKTKSVSKSEPAIFGQNKPSGSGPKLNPQAEPFVPGNGSAIFRPGEASS